ncbi:helix-turn-helix domain-containing protein [Glycomyces salinus]|uniref:helix-turn-helix domain-containing protein n=1 Tax=Glycomyces salinus TaxID=980294 RepID=UPI0018EC83A8|nr:helix-turn-helix transcriptional regulator [Glycomyces salinus]
MPRSSSQPSLRSQWLGEKLRNLRKERKITQPEAASYIQRDPTMLGRYESGEFPFRRVDVVGLLTMYGVDDEKVRDGLLEICDEAWRKDWWDEHRSIFTEDFIDVPWLDSHADHILAYQHFVVHGLQQTREYAEAVITRIEQPDTPHEEIERHVDIRMERQQIFSSERPPRLSVVMEESALSRMVGSAEIMRGQLRHLLELSADDRVSIRIAPTEVGPHAGLNGTFVLYKLPEPYPTVANVETTAGSLYLEEPKATRFLSVWEDLDRSALSPKKSVELIARHLKEYQ